MPIITFLTDFGLRDSYVAQMKGAVLSICPDATLVDITHQIPPGEITSGAFVLSTAIESFPDGTIHLAVVDPGVGTARRRIIVEARVADTKRAFFVGPDNGLFSLAAPAARRKRIVEITRQALLPPVQHLSTFDGRDIFAPVAALLAAGRKIEEFGEVVSDISELNLPLPTVQSDGSVRGEVIYIDHYGNAISNITRELVFPGYRVELESNNSLDISSAANYEEIPQRRAAALLNSAGLLELACNRSSAAEFLGLRRGDSILVRKD